MKTGMFLIIVGLLFLFGCCDQTFILHRDSKIPVDTGRNVQEYNYIYKETIVPAVETTKPTEPSNGGSGHGKTPGGEVHLVVNPDQRMITFNITSDYPGGTLDGANILMNGTAPSFNNFYDVHSYEYIIQKTGYYPIKGNVEEGKADVTISQKMQCKPREIRLNITDAVKSDKIPCNVLIEFQKVNDGDLRKPGAKGLKIQADGYQNHEEPDFVLPVGEGIFEISKALKPVPKVPQIVVKPPVVVAPKANITLQLEITGDIPKGELVYVRTIMVSDKEMESGDIIEPGRHNVVIRCDGYEVYQNNIQVPSGVSPYILKAELISLPRAIETLVSYDVTPSQGQNAKLGPCQVYLSQVGSSEKIPVESGKKVKPGRYALLIKRAAYEDCTDTLTIQASNAPYKIQKTMIAKARIVQADVEFDIAPSGDASYLVEFITVDKEISCAVKPGESIKPGKYNYKVTKPGYQMVGGLKSITIEPDEEAFGIQETLNALPRKLSFETNYQGKAIRPKEVRVGEQLTSYETPYAPGKYRIEVKFDDYQTIQKDIVVTPGVGDFVVPLTLEKK